MTTGRQILERAGDSGLAKGSRRLHISSYQGEGQPSPEGGQNDHQTTLRAGTRRLPQQGEQIPPLDRADLSLRLRAGRAPAGAVSLLRFRRVLPPGI